MNRREHSLSLEVERSTSGGRSIATLPIGREAVSPESTSRTPARLPLRRGGAARAALERRPAPPDDDRRHPPITSAIDSPRSTTEMEPTMADEPDVLSDIENDPEWVRYLQQTLDYWGVWSGEQDGVFSPELEQCVKDFQAQQNLVVDGWVGPRTWWRVQPRGSGPHRTRPVPQSSRSSARSAATSRPSNSRSPPARRRRRPHLQRVRRPAGLTVGGRRAAFSEHDQPFTNERIRKGQAHVLLCGIHSAISVPGSPTAWRRLPSWPRSAAGSVRRLSVPTAAGRDRRRPRTHRERHGLQQSALENEGKAEEARRMRRRHGRTPTRGRPLQELVGAN